MHDPSTHDCHSATPEAVKKLSMMMAFTMALFGMDSRSQHEILASVNKPRYFTWYDIDADNQTKYGANLVWDRNLTTLDKAFADYKVQGMWSITGRCDVGVNKVYAEAQPAWSTHHAQTLPRAGRSGPNGRSIKSLDARISSACTLATSQRSWACPASRCAA